jgi:hypothetical protein
VRDSCANSFAALLSLRPVAPSHQTLTTLNRPSLGEPPAASLNEDGWGNAVQMSVF